jgi:hypothetical protein
MTPRTPKASEDLRLETSARLKKALEAVERLPFGWADGDSEEVYRDHPKLWLRGTVASRKGISKIAKLTTKLEAILEQIQIEETI